MKKEHLKENLVGKSLNEQCLDWFNEKRKSKEYPFIEESSCLMPDDGFNVK